MPVQFLLDRIHLLLELLDLSVMVDGGGELKKSESYETIVTIDRIKLCRVAAFLSAIEEWRGWDSQKPLITLINLNNKANLTTLSYRPQLPSLMGLGP